MAHYVNVPELDRQINAKLQRQSFPAWRATSDPVNVSLSKQLQHAVLIG